MEIKFDEEHINIIRSVADRCNVDSDKLYEMYQQVMRSNFEQDLWDIATENEEELK